MDRQYTRDMVVLTHRSSAPGRFRRAASAMPRALSRSVETMYGTSVASFTATCTLVEVSRGIVVASLGRGRRVDVTRAPVEAAPLAEISTTGQKGLKRNRAPGAHCPCAQ